MSIQDEPKVMAGRGLRAWAGMAAMVAALGVSHSDNPDYVSFSRPPQPRKKSTHKRKHKGSKAAKKANRRKA